MVQDKAFLRNSVKGKALTYLTYKLVSPFLVVEFFDSVIWNLCTYTHVTRVHSKNDVYVIYDGAREKEKRKSHQKYRNEKRHGISTTGHEKKTFPYH